MMKTMLIVLLMAGIVVAAGGPPLWGERRAARTHRPAG
jgi:hypothetical protein